MEDSHSSILDFVIETVLRPAGLKLEKADDQ